MNIDCNNDIVEYLRDMRKNIMPNPYKDHIIVIHPCNRYRVQQLFGVESINANIPEGFPQNYYGMQVYEDNRASMTKVEIMHLLAYYEKYPPIFPKQYSRAFIIWDNVTTRLRRWYMDVKWHFRKFTQRIRQFIFNAGK